MIKQIAKYVLAPGAGAAMLAGFGVFDLGAGSGAGGSSAGLTSAGAAGDQILSALEGPLAVAQRIATAGAGFMDMDPSQLPDFMTGDAAGIPAGAGAGAGTGGGAPVAAVKTVGASGGASAEAAGIMPSGGAWKSSRPPATE